MYICMFVCKCVQVCLSVSMYVWVHVYRFLSPVSLYVFCVHVCMMHAWMDSPYVDPYKYNKKGTRKWSPK